MLTLIIFGLIKLTFSVRDFVPIHFIFLTISVFFHCIHCFTLLYTSTFLVYIKGKIRCPQSGKKFWSGYGTKCCGSSRTYDPNQEKCCSGTNKIVEKNSKCGKESYNKCEKLCCDGKHRPIFKNGEERFCCGRNSYGKAKHICCGGIKQRKYLCNQGWEFHNNKWRKTWHISSEKRCSNGQRLTYVSVYNNEPCPYR